MRNPTPLKRSPIFIFGPPLILGTLGLGLVLQSGMFASPEHTIIAQQVEAFQAQNLTPPTPEMTDYLYPRSTIDFANQQYVVVNKHRELHPIDYAPAILVAAPSSESLDNSRELLLTPATATALVEMAKDMYEQGYGKLFVNSAYRTYEYQTELFQSKTSQYGLAEALIRSAKAGHSEHQTGLAVDVSVPDQGCAIMQCFGDTKAGQWIADNAWRYGFIIRYEKDTTVITGYTYEPWHLRYVGIELTEIYSQNGIQTLEEFWGLSAAEFYLDEMTESTID